MRTKPEIYGSVGQLAVVHSDDNDDDDEDDIDKTFERVKSVSNSNCELSISVKIFGTIMRIFYTYIDLTKSCSIL